MRHLAIAVIAAASTVAFTQTASSADLPRKAPAYVPPPAVLSWTGFYVGGNVGAAWVDPRLNTTLTTCGLCVFNPVFDPRDLAAINAAGSPNLNSTNFTGGVQVGYNYQIGSVVFGIEGDFESFHSNKSQTIVGPFLGGPGNFFTVSTSSSTDWLATVRGRIGFLALPNLLLYGTGGLAITDIEVSNSYVDTFNPIATGSSSNNVTRAGWTVGGGAEYALDRNWSVKAEYLYLDFGTVSTTMTVTRAGTTPSPVTTSDRFTAQIGRAGVNYKF
jgi:outer membrane immunogenic protein